MRTIFFRKGFVSMRSFSVFLSLFLFGFTSCGKAQIRSSMFDSTVEKLLSGTVDTISVTELKKASNENELVLLDSREKREYEVSHLNGAQWVGYNDFDLSRLDSVDTASTIVIYCSVGYRSEKIGEKLKAAGYSKVFNLYGGIFEWVNQSGEIYNTLGETENVHGYDEKWALFVQKGKVVLK